MAERSALDRLRAGLAVQTSDGKPLGTITKVWPLVGTGEAWGAAGARPLHGVESADTREFAFSEAMPGAGDSYFHLQHPQLGDLYVPFSYVAEVRDDAVLLSVEADDVALLQWDVKPDFLHENDPTIPVSEGSAQAK